MDLISNISSAMDEYITKFKVNPLMRINGFKEFLKDKGITNVSTSDILKAFKSQASVIKEKYSDKKNNNNTKKADATKTTAKATSKPASAPNKVQNTPISNADYDTLWGGGKDTNTKAVNATSVPKPTSAAGLVSKYGSKAVGASKKALGAVAKSVGKGNIAIGTVAATADIIRAYADGGMSEVKNQLPNLIASYGMGAVGAALAGAGTALVTKNPVITGAASLTGGLLATVAGDKLAKKYLGVDKNGKPIINENNVDMAEIENTIKNFDMDKVNQTLAEYQATNRELEEEQAKTSQARQNLITANEAYMNSLEQAKNIAKNGGRIQQPSNSIQQPVQNTPTQPQQTLTQTTPEVVSQTASSINPQGGVDMVADNNGNPVPTSEDIFFQQMTDYLKKSQEQDAQVRKTMMETLNEGYNNMKQASAVNPYYMGEAIQPQGYYVDTDKLAREQAMKGFFDRYDYFSGNTNVAPDDAQRRLANAEQLYQARMANQAGVPYADYVKGITDQRVRQLENEKFRVEQTLKYQYQMAQDDTERAKILADIYKVRQDYNQAIDVEIIKGQNTLNNTQLVNRGNIQQAGIEGLYDIEKAKVQGGYDLDKANIQGMYNLKQEKMKQDNPYKNIRDLGQGLGMMWGTNPQGAASVINSLPTETQNQVFPNMTKEGMTAIGRLQGQNQATQGGLSAGQFLQNLRNNMYNSNGGLQADER